jgi:hypothetical protein
MVITGLGAVVALVVVLTSAVTQRPIPGLIWVLIPAVPVVALGQVWTISAMQRRRPSGANRRWRPPASFRGSTDWFFSPLPRRTIFGLSGVIVVGWLSMMTAFPFLWSGQPSTNADPACPDTADNHGSVTCISRSTFLRADAAQQRLAAGFFLFVFTLQFGVAWSETARGNEPETGGGGP